MASLHDEINAVLVRYYDLWNDWKMDELRRLEVALGRAS